MLNLTSQLQSTTTKVREKAVELELRKLQVAQAQDQLAMMSVYLPDGFFKEDQSAIECILVLKRLLHKAGLVFSFVEEKKTRLVWFHRVR